MTSKDWQSAGNLFKTNLASGLVVFLIALPLCLGISLASGAPPLSGIIAGIVGGIVIGSLSTSHISVAGPAAGLTAIVFLAIEKLGFEMFLAAVLIAGIVQLLLGLFRAGSMAEYIPTAAIEGMLAGIGVIIILKEIPYAFGVADGSVAHLPQLLGHSQWTSLVIAALSLFLLIRWEQLPLPRWLRALPAALVVVIVAVLVHKLFGLFGFTMARDQLVQLPVVKSWEDFKGFFTMLDFRGFLNGYVWQTGITMALVASIETLLCIEAADRLDKRRRITDTNRELRAHGIANSLCAFIGGLPITSVIVRSSANANAGATHKLSTICHGLLLLVCVLTIPGWLNEIPLAALAAVLLQVGYRLTRPATIKHFWHKGPYQFIPFIATMIAVVWLDLLKGVAVGLVISIGFILQGNMKRAYYLSREQLADAEEIKLNLAEEVSFLNKAAIKKTLKNVPPHSKIIINAERSAYIASDVLELIEDFANVYAVDNDIEVVLQGFRSDYEEQADHHKFVKIKHSQSI